MEPRARTSTPRHATGDVELVPLAAVDADATFRLRPEGDVASLAASLGRLGQLVPVELRLLPEPGVGGPRYQVVAGFRRLEALRCLRRDRALARVHAELPDEDAWAIALADALLREPLGGEELDALRERLAGEPAAAWALEHLDEARARAPVAPAEREAFLAWLRRASPAADADETVEVTPEELAEDLAARMYAVNADLALASEAWEHLPPEGRRAIVEQARYVAALLPHLPTPGED